MTPQDKEIKFKVGVDEASIRKGISLIREFQREAQKLAQELNRAMTAANGQRGAGMSMSSNSTFNPANEAIRNNAQNAGMGGLFTKQLLENKQLFQAIATGTKDALARTSTAVKDELGKQQAEIRKLRYEAEQLGKEYQHLQKFNMPGPAQKAAQNFFNKNQEIANASGREQLLQDRYAQLNQPAASPMGQGVRQMLGSVGINNAMINAGGAATIGYIVGKTLVNSLRSGSQEAAQSPHDFVTRSVKQGGSYGGAAMGIRHGDLSLLHAFSMMRGNSRFSEDFDRLKEGAQGLDGRGSILPEGMAGIGVGDFSGIFGRNRGGGIEFNKSNWRLWDVIGRNVKRAILGADPIGAIDDTLRSKGNIPVDQTTQMLDYAQKMEQANPLAFAGVRQFQETAGAGINQMRGLGQGTRTKRYEWSKSGNMFLEGLSYAQGGDSVIKENSAARTLRKYQDRAISPEEVIAGQHAVEGVAGFHAGQSLRHQAVYGNLGGHVPNAALMAGTGALVGNKGLWGQFTGALGGNGGMDIGAGSKMAGTLSGALLAGNPITSGEGMLGALYQYGRGRNSAEDMLIQNFMPQGLGAMGQVTGGGIDAYQSGSNLLNAIQALPKGSVMAQEYLAQMDPATIAEVMAGGEVPAELRARGITADAVKSYAKKTFARAYDRNIGASPGQDGDLNDVQKQAKIVTEQYGGDFGKFLKEGGDRLGLKGNALKDFQRRALVNQGAFYQDIGWAGSDMAGQSLARIQGGLGTKGSFVNGKRVGGRGIGDSASGSDQLLQQSKTSQFEGENEKWIEENTEHIQGMIAQRKQSSENLNQIGQSVGAAADLMAAKLNSLTDAIVDAERRIRGKPSGGAATARK